jgi:hypothetical protein
MNRTLVAALTCLAGAPALAGNTLIDFETVTGFASILDYYDGGADSSGASGPDLGVTFSGDALGLVNDFETYFNNAPSPIGTMTPVGPDATLNVAVGFTDAISFHYAASRFVLTAVNVWSGLNATGELLASFNLVPNARAGGCTGSNYCHFDLVSSTFYGTAHSVSFGNAANAAVFDDIQISTVPEPASALLMLVGAAGLLALRRRS